VAASDDQATRVHVLRDPVAQDTRSDGEQSLHRAADVGGVALGAQAEHGVQHRHRERRDADERLAQREAAEARRDEQQRHRVHELTRERPAARLALGGRRCIRPEFGAALCGLLARQTDPRIDVEGAERIGSRERMPGRRLERDVRIGVHRDHRVLSRSA